VNCRKMLPILHGEQKRQSERIGEFGQCKMSVMKKEFGIFCELPACDTQYNAPCEGIVKTFIEDF